MANKKGDTTRIQAVPDVNKCTNLGCYSMKEREAYAVKTRKDQIITGEGIEEMLPENTYILKEGEKYYTVHKSEIRERIEKEELPSDEVEEMQRNGFEVKENEER